MKKYLKLLRVKHYLKNALVFAPLFFSKQFFNTDKILSAVLCFVSFCLFSSAVYILNDIKDVEKDRLHPVKKNRPIASGEIKVSTAWIVFAVCIVLGCVVAVLTGKGLKAFIYPAVYIILNILYSMGLKNVPIVDVVILTSGFIIRILYGGAITDIKISEWLYLTVMAASFYMGLGKRRNELKKHSESDTRKVLSFYNENYLDKMMYMCMTLTVCFYSLWTMNSENKMIIWTVPFVLVILMKYSLDVESRDSEGDPIEIILGDKVLIILAALYAAALCTILYIL